MSLKVDVKKNFDGFSIEIAFNTENKWQGILGASGCGKSITLKMIAGIITPDEGEIILDGEVLFDSKKKINLPPQKRRVGYLFQNYALFPNMTVEENIKCGIYKRREKNIEPLVELLHLHGLEKRFPRELSGGQQQRVALARCLACEPKIIMLDEPFSALDEFLRERLQQDVKKVLKEFKGEVLFVSHSRDEIYRFCDRIIIIDEGRVIIEGKTDEVFEEPKSLVAAKLSGCKNISDIKKLDKRTLKALDWNVILKTQEDIGENITHVGIRAHDIRQEKNDENSMVSVPAEIQEGLFETTMVFPVGERSLWWKQAKSNLSKKGYEYEPMEIYLPAEKLLLLSGGNHEKD